MNKELYLGIKAQLEATVPELKTIRLFNNQFAHSNNETGKDEQAFLYPCCFIEFMSIDFTTSTTLLQSFTGIIRLHIGFESYNLEDLDVLTLKQKIYTKLSGFQVSSIKTFGKMIRLHEETDTDHDNIYIYIQDYQMSGKDCEFSSRDTNVEVAPPIALELPTVLDIDNVVIRTGDGL